MNNSNAWRRGLSTTAPAPGQSPSRPALAAHRVSVSGSGHTLGGSTSDIDARAAQQRDNESSIAQHKEKEKEKQQKKLEEKIARYSFLNISIGNKLGQCELTLEQVREMQDQKNSDILNTLKIRDMENEKRSPMPQTPVTEDVKDHDTVMREMRLRQQEKYSATIQKKPSC